MSVGTRNVCEAVPWERLCVSRLVSQEIHNQTASLSHTPYLQPPRTIVLHVPCLYYTLKLISHDA